MPRPLSVDLRERIIEAREAGEKAEDVATRFKVGIASVGRFDGKAKRGESLEPGVSTGRPPRLDESDRAVLTALVIDKSDLTIAELKTELVALTGKVVSSSTVSRALAALGLPRKKKQFTRRSATPSA